MSKPKNIPLSEYIEQRRQYFHHCVEVYAWIIQQQELMDSSEETQSVFILWHSLN